MLVLSACTSTDAPAPDGDEVSETISMPGQNRAANIDDEEDDVDDEDEAADADAEDNEDDDDKPKRPARRGFSTLLGSTVAQEDLKDEPEDEVREEDLEEDDQPEAQEEAVKPKKKPAKKRKKRKTPRPTPEQEAAAYELLNNPATYEPEPSFPDEAPQRTHLRLRRYAAPEDAVGDSESMTPMPNSVELHGLRSPGLRRGTLPMDINGKLTPANSN